MMPVCASAQSTRRRGCRFPAPLRLSRQRPGSAGGGRWRRRLPLPGRAARIPARAADGASTPCAGRSGAGRSRDRDEAGLAGELPERRDRRAVGAVGTSPIARAPETSSAGGAERRCPARRNLGPRGLQGGSGRPEGPRPASAGTRPRAGPLPHRSRSRSGGGVAAPGRVRGLRRGPARLGRVERDHVEPRRDGEYAVVDPPLQ